MSEWVEKRLEDILEIKHGFAFKGEHFSNLPTKYYLVTPANFAIGGGFQKGKEIYYIGDFPKEYILEKNDLIVTMTDLSKTGDTLGFSALVPENVDYEYLHNQRIGKVIVNEKIADKKFIYWVMRTYSYQRYVVGLATGSTVKHTSPKSIKSFNFKFPPLLTQIRIANILSSYDDAIENNNRRIALLDKAARKLYREWFVKFRFPGYEDVRFVNGLPEGWEVKRLGGIIKFTNGKSRPKTIGNVPVYGGNGVLAYCDMNNQENGIIIGRVGAYCGNVFYERKPHWVSDNAIAAKNKKNCTIDFAYHLLQQLNLNQRQTGTGQPLLTQDLLNKIKIVLPPYSLLHSFSKLARNTKNLSDNIQSQSQNLARQRDLLLPRLMSGKLEV